MVFQAVVLGVVVMKVYTAFKTGQRCSVKKMRDAAERELLEMNVPRDFAKDIITGVEQRIQVAEVTPEEFIQALKEVVNELAGKVKTGAKEGLASAMNIATGMTNEARQGLAEMLRQAAESLVGGGEKKSAE